MTKPSKSRKKAKPNHQAAKPYPDFPLCIRADGRLCKKIRQRIHYFGHISDWQRALKTYQDQCDDLYAGRVPRSKQTDEPTLKDLCNAFLTSKQDKFTRRRLSPRTYYDLHEACRRLIERFGKDRLAADFEPTDFSEMKRRFPLEWGVHRCAREIQGVRSIFQYGMQQGIIKKVVLFGADFCKPNKKEVRLDRAEKKTKNGLKMFDADEIRSLLDAAGVQLKAMIHLAGNCGFGPTDLGSLTFNVIDLDRGIVDFPRPKSGIERRCPLWPETVQALRDAIAARPAHKDEANAKRVFITKYGKAWVRVGVEEHTKDERATAPEKDKACRLLLDNAVSKEFDKLQREVGVKRPGRGVYSLRHTTQTIGGEARDPDAVRMIMGHADQSMSDAYREKIDDSRLQRVADHVRQWLFGSKPADAAILPLTGRAAR
jgi:integrase